MYIIKYAINEYPIKRPVLKFLYMLLRSIATNSGKIKYEKSVSETISHSHEGVCSLLNILPREK